MILKITNQLCLLTCFHLQMGLKFPQTSFWVWGFGTHMNRSVTNPWRILWQYSRKSQLRGCIRVRIVQPSWLRVGLQRDEFRSR
jgi:hypothetical protein